MSIGCNFMILILFYPGFLLLTNTLRASSRTPSNKEFPKPGLFINYVLLIFQSIGQTEDIIPKVSLSFKLQITFWLPSISIN